MKKHPVLFKICLILLLFGIASVQALKDSENCKHEKTQGASCQKSAQENIEPEYDDPENQKSVFSKSHDCRSSESTDNGDADSESSCFRAEPVEDEDQSELSMLGEQTRKEEAVKPCEVCEEEVSAECAEKISDGETSLDEPGDGHAANIEPVLESPETVSEEDAGETDRSSDEQMENPEEAEQNEQDPELRNVPLREILLKLKPEGLTDNEDDQPSDYSVTEVSMGEEEEVEEEILVSSGSAEKQESSLDSSNNNGSKNGSGSSGTGISKKAVCLEVNITESFVDVEIINATLLMKLLQGNPNVTNRSSAAPCHLIYFFSPYCPFSVAGSPYVNAMARSLKNIPVFGLDSIEHHSVNARYGVVGTPTLLLFHNGNGVGRYNASEFSVMQLLAFINHYTDQSITDINVTSADFRATLPAQIDESRPYALWASWIFLLSFASWLFITSELCARLTEAILNNWREAEAQNDQD